MVGILERYEVLEKVGINAKGTLADSECSVL